MANLDEIYSMITSSWVTAGLKKRRRKKQTFQRNKGQLHIYNQPKTLRWQEISVPSSKQMFHRLSFTNPYISVNVSNTIIRPQFPIRSAVLATSLESNLKMPRHLWCSLPLKSRNTEEKHRGRSMVWVGKYQAKPWGSHSKCLTDRNHSAMTNQAC